MTLTVEVGSRIGVVADVDLLSITLGFLEISIELGSLSVSCLDTLLSNGLQARCNGFSVIIT